MWEILKTALALIVLVFGSRLMLSEITNISKLMRASAFGLSVVVLGFLTSLPEISIALNAQFERRPEIYAGNLMGGSFLLLSFVIPLFTLLKGGLSIKKQIDTTGLVALIGLLSIPIIASFNGFISRWEGAMMIIGYGTFIVLSKPFRTTLRPTDTPASLSAVAVDFLKLGFIAMAIYFACIQLVHATEVFAVTFNIPAFLISFFLLALGANIPELTLAAQSLLGKKTEVAFGDYIGSAAMNPLMMGILTVYNGAYHLGTEASSWLLVLFLATNVLFLLFAASKRTISVREAMCLLGLYTALLAQQLFLA